MFLKVITILIFDFLAQGTNNNHKNNNVIIGSNI